MARVVAYIPDLLFGSQVQGALQVAGHEVELVADASIVGDEMGATDILVFDLTDDVLGRIGTFETLRGEVERIRALAFYSHVDADTRVLAEAAGFDLVVPRSRIAREVGTLIDWLVDSG